MLEITRDNCNKCHLETITDPIIVNILGLIEEI